MVLRLSTFPSDVLDTSLAGFSTASSAQVAATDDIVVAIGKLQAQTNLAAFASGTSYTAGYTGASTRTVQKVLDEVVSVTDFGAVAGGTTDCTAAFNKALAAAQRVVIPGGNYLIAGTITSRPTAVSSKARG